MNRSDFLFATPSFLGGMASALDFGANLVVYNESPTTEEADNRAIAADWRVTGKDIETAMKQWSEENEVDE